MGIQPIWRPVCVRCTWRKLKAHHPSLVVMSHVGRLLILLQVGLIQSLPKIRMSYEKWQKKTALTRVIWVVPEFFWLLPPSGSRVLQVDEHLQSFDAAPALSKHRTLMGPLVWQYFIFIEHKHKLVMVHCKITHSFKLVFMSVCVNLPLWTHRCYNR